MVANPMLIVTYDIFFGIPQVQPDYPIEWLEDAFDVQGFTLVGLQGKVRPSRTASQFKRVKRRDRHADIFDSGLSYPHQKQKPV